MEGEGFVGGEVGGVDGAGGGVDVGGFGVGEDVESEAGGEGFGGVEEEGLAVFDDSADVVGEAAVGEGDVAAAFEDGDGGCFVEAAQSGGCGHAAGDATDDEVVGCGLVHSPSIDTPRGILQYTPVGM